MTDAAPANGGQGDEPAAWYATMPEDLRGYVQNKGWKDPADLATSYVNLEKLRGVPAERLLAMPEKADDPKWGEVWTKLGKPEKPDDYGLLTKEGMDPEFAKQASQWLHELNLPKTAGSALVEKLSAFAAAQQEAANTAKMAAATEQEAQLKAEWGGAHDQNLEIGRRAARQFGLDEATLAGIEESIGYKATLQLFHKIGAALGEAEPVGMGGQPGGQRALTPEAAKSRISALMGDKDWTAKYINGDAEARAEMDRLNRAAVGG